MDLSNPREPAYGIDYWIVNPNAPIKGPVFDWMWERRKEIKNLESLGKPLPEKFLVGKEFYSMLKEYVRANNEKLGNDVENVEGPLLYHGIPVVTE